MPEMLNIFNSRVTEGHSDRTAKLKRGGGFIYVTSTDFVQRPAVLMKL